MNRMSVLRKSADMKQVDVAKELGIDTSTVAKWETGASMPRADKLPILAKLYGCSIDQLFKADEEESR